MIASIPWLHSCSSWKEFWFVKVVPKYLSSSTLSKELLSVGILWLSPAFWSRDMTMYLCFYAPYLKNALEIFLFGQQTRESCSKHVIHYTANICKSSEPTGSEYKQLWHKTTSFLTDILYAACHLVFLRENKVSVKRHVSNVRLKCG
jgi:hypothetical protein